MFQFKAFFGLTAPKLPYAPGDAFLLKDKSFDIFQHMGRSYSFQGPIDGSGNMRNLLPIKLKVSANPVAINLEGAGEIPAASNDLVIPRSRKATAPTNKQYSRVSGAEFHLMFRLNKRSIHRK